jgi:ectoine hydroxylase-related dioxygenase (phytanoyl-CoA dioxygenase family)
MDVLTARERQQLDADGFLALNDIVDRASVQAMRTRLEELLAVTEQTHAGTLIVGGLLEETVFDPAWKHPRILAAAGHILGNGYRLMGIGSRGLRPGHGQQALHVDWGGPIPPGVWYSCHAICALVDFTPENGATRVVPGSHRNPRLVAGKGRGDKGYTDPNKPHPLQRQLVGPAGSVFVLNIHCFHSAMLNRSEEPRLALFANFSRRDSPLLHANTYQEPSPDPSPAVLARHDPEIRAMLLG